ncbi:glycosyltransferase family 39 protein [Rhodobacteraceae bacterium LMO-12]|nr:glycosyltransferase family 39 protein [Rhodobacteraceae bacterium LMO-JJ12]
MVALERNSEIARKRRQKAAAGTFALSDKDRRFLIGALVALIAIRLLMIFWLPVIDSTEARYIEIARKMLVSGDWITPQFDYGVPFWGKPPLHTWLSALGMKIFGVGNFGARIFIFLASVITVIIVFDWVRRNRGRDQALIAIAVTVSSLLFFGASAFVMTDMVMVLGTTLSMVAFYNCACGSRSHRIWGNMFFVGLAIGLMAKGPVAVVLTAIPLVLWILVGRRWHLLGRLPWATGLILLTALTLPWYLVAEIRTPGFLRYFLIGEHYERFVVPGWSGDLYGSGHMQPKGMIWIYALAVFLPWSLFASALVVKRREIIDLMRDEDEGWLSYLAFWVLSPLILFTPAANILPAYALPAVPAAAILLTSIRCDLWVGPATATRIAFGVAIATTAGLYLAVSLVAHLAPSRLTNMTDLMLVEQAHQIDPEMPLTYWGGRSFSGEFYTRGALRYATEPEHLRALVTNARRDAIALPPQALAEVIGIVGSQFRNAGQFGRRILLVENPMDGEKS